MTLGTRLLWVSALWWNVFTVKALATYRLRYEDDYEYEFSVLTTRFRFGGRKFSKCACSELKTRPRTPNLKVTINEHAISVSQRLTWEVKDKRNVSEIIVYGEKTNHSYSTNYDLRKRVRQKLENKTEICASHHQKAGVSYLPWPVS